MLEKQMALSQKDLLRRIKQKGKPKEQIFRAQGRPSKISLDSDPEILKVTPS